MARKKKRSNVTEEEWASREAEKAIKKNPKLFVTLFAIFLSLVIVAGIVYYFFFYKKDTDLPTGETPSTGTPDEEDPNKPSTGTPEEKPDEGGFAQVGAPVITEEELSIHFLELGNKYAGDSTLLKIGNTEILIDAGSRQGSAATLVPYINTYCTDGVLEYVIATHADQDHISAFIGTKAAPGIFDSFECKTIIDFARTNKNTETVKNYYAKRDAEVEAGAVHYTSLQCWNETDGAQRSYQISDTVIMQVLYNYYYENKSSDENNYSVCLLFTQGENNYLFTGDLEKEGEEYLVQNNSLPQVKLFKGGHHGSKTSSNEVLLNVIRPEIVCVCCCAGAPEYTQNPDNVFPTQAFIDRVGKYTDKVFVTTLATEIDLENEKWNYTSMNGNIVIVSDGKRVSVYCSNNTTLLKDTEWFKENRVWSGV